MFNILNDFSTRIWKQQTEIIAGKFGLMSFIVHPDYVIKNRERAIYKELLKHLVKLSEEKSVWLTTPSEVNKWWRQRAQMKLVPTANGWSIENPGDGRARIAYASLKGDRVVYEVESSTAAEYASGAVHAAEALEATLTNNNAAHLGGIAASDLPFAR
jgi:hypothetical protein